MLSPKELVDFEKQVVQNFNDGKIFSPIHLSGSVNNVQEKELIKIFEDVKPQDWIFTTYRSHYHALLKGVDRDWLMKWILDNKSIHVMNKEHKIVTSAIVGGTLSQAVGCAMAIKLKRDIVKELVTKEIDSMSDVRLMGEVEVIDGTHVWCFCGDMTASLGVFEDCWSYSFFNDLPITFVIEDNGLSTDTPTSEAWGGEPSFLGRSKIKYYKYKRKYPHYGSGKFVSKLWEKEDVKAKGF